MKKIILIFGIILCVYNVGAQNDIASIRNQNALREKCSEYYDLCYDVPLISVSCGTSIRMGTLLFPSLDAYIVFGPLEFEGYWKYSEWCGIPLHSFSGGVNFYLKKFSDSDFLFLSYNYITNADSEILKVSDNNFIDRTSDGHAFCIGFNGNRVFYTKIGFMINSGLQDKWDPRIELGFKLPPTGIGKILEFKK